MEEKSIIQHIGDLRKTLIAGLLLFLAGWIAGYLLYPLIIRYLLSPLELIKDRLPGDGSLLITSLVEGFFVRIKIGGIAGLILGLPFHVLNLMLFIRPALSPRETRMTIAVVLIGSLLGTSAVIYVYHVLIPVSVSFLTSGLFLPRGTDLFLTFEKNIFYILQFMLGGAIVFQVPVVLFGLLKWEVVTVKACLRASRFVVLAAFLLSAVLTPPDVVSQLFLALPLILLYYVTVALGFLVISKKKRG